MLILGVDVGFRNFGHCLIQVNGKPEILGHGTHDIGNTTNWRVLFPAALELIRDYAPTLVSIEELVWYGKRKGVLALAHLAGAVAGFSIARGTQVTFFQPRDVKAMSRTYPAPAGFTEHEHDALSLCRLAMGKVLPVGKKPEKNGSGTKWNDGKGKLAGKAKPARPLSR